MNWLKDRLVSLVKWIKIYLIRLVTARVPDPVYSKPIALPPNLGKDGKMSVLSQVHEQVGQMVMHLDSLRQHNLNVALVVFAGLFGFQVKFGEEAHYWLVGVATTFIMTIFFLLDFKYHVYGHGYQAVLRKVTEMMAQADSATQTEFDPYDFRYAETAELSSLSAIVYYSLIAVGALLGAALQLEWIQFSHPPDTIEMQQSQSPSRISGPSQVSTWVSGFSYGGYREDRMDIDYDEVDDYTLALLYVGHIEGQVRGAGLEIVRLGHDEPAA